jgi:hypothetical protein
MTVESIFVSYSSEDRPFAVGLTKALQKSGANVWIDRLGIGLGENWDNAIEEALEKSETLMLILSPTSVESRNVQDEVSIAINADKKFVPILIKECDLPMRWQRRQYADLINDPEKAIGDILKFLGLQDEAAANLRNVLSLIGVSEAPPKVLKTVTEKGSEPKQQEVNLEDLLISEPEIDQAIVMHKKGIKKNWQLTGLVLGISLILLAIYFIFIMGSISQNDNIKSWMIITGCLIINLLIIKPFGRLKKHERIIDLLNLLKLKRDRLIRAFNNIEDDEIEKFNTEFDNYLTL